MSQKRRLAGQQRFQRRVKPRREEDRSDIESESGNADAQLSTGQKYGGTSSTTVGDDSGCSDSELSEAGSDEDEGEGLNSDEEDGTNDDDDYQSDEAKVQNSLREDMGSVSFGALAKAQESLQRQIKQDHPRARRAALAELRESHAKTKSTAGRTTIGPGAGRLSAGSVSPTATTPHRTNKHAPTETSSKKAVSRKRRVIEMPRREEARDPRFESLSGPTIDENKLRKKYSFIEEYRDGEMKKLAESIKKTKDPDRKAVLKRELLSMQSRKQAQERKDKDREVLRTHRTKEKELVRAGKKPFYLKKSQQKKLALINRYQDYVSKGSNKKRSNKDGAARQEVAAGGTDQPNANSAAAAAADQNRSVNKKLERVMDRRRRKNTAKERKMMPLSRRRAGAS